MRLEKLPEESTDTLRQSFDWSEVSCFLRPQAILCDLVSRGTGMLLLGMASLYRSSGIDGFYVDPTRDHFAFLTGPFQRVAGVHFEVTQFSESDDVVGRLTRQLLPEAGASIVPADLRCLPSTAWYGREHRRHFFLITDYDSLADALEAYDNVHVESNGLSLRYEKRALPRPTVERMVRSYRDHYAGLPSTSTYATGYWTLQVGNTTHTVPRSEDEALACFLAECERVLARIEENPAMSQSFDNRHHAELKRANEWRALGRLDSLALEYLADANHASVYVQIVVHALGQRGSSSAAAHLASELAEYKRRASTVRMQLLTRCMSGAPIPLAKWEDARTKLCAASQDLRRSLLSAIRRAG